jgi:hypothetical protein
VKAVLPLSATLWCRYAVNGKQYIAVVTGEGQTGTTRLLDQLPGFRPVRGHNAVYVFALP